MSLFVNLTQFVKPAFLYIEFLKAWVKLHFPKDFMLKVWNSWELLHLSGFLRGTQNGGP